VSVVEALGKVRLQVRLYLLLQPLTLTSPEEPTEEPPENQRRTIEEPGGARGELDACLLFLQCYIDVFMCLLCGDAGASPYGHIGHQSFRVHWKRSEPMMSLHTTYM